MNLNYEECLNFISDTLHIKLTKIQKNIIKAMMTGCVYSVPRGMGVTFCTKLIAAYTNDKYDRVERPYNHDELEKHYNNLDDIYADCRFSVPRRFKSFYIK